MKHYLGAALLSAIILPACASLPSQEDIVVEQVKAIKALDPTVEHVVPIYCTQVLGCSAGVITTGDETSVNYYVPYDKLSDLVGTLHNHPPTVHDSEAIALAFDSVNKYPSSTDWFNGLEFRINSGNPHTIYIIGPDGVTRNYSIP